MIADLPTERVSSEPPFTHTGVDFAGPLYAKPTKESEEVVKVCVSVHLCLYLSTTSRSCSRFVSSNFSPSISSILWP